MMNTVNRNPIKLPVIVAVLLLWVLPSTAQQIAVKTNAVADLGMLPNLGVELTVGEKSSLEFALTGTVSEPWGQDFNTTVGSFQYRYWMPQRALTQLFFGVGAKAGSYQLNKKTSLCEGDFAVAELVGGWAWPIAKRWNLEFSYGFGLLMRHQYEKDFVSEAKVMPNVKCDIATTTLGVSIVYIIK